VTEPQLALYRFSAALPGSECHDAVTGARVRFPYVFALPQLSATVANPIALLTVPANRDAFVHQAFGGRVTDGRVPPYLWTHAYRVFGYEEERLEVGAGRLLYVSACLLAILLA
jgi:hypothetical protein